ncbi:TetR/AcrR family transcriptional regulator [Paenibacillus sp. PCH8]|uniref:TetR/AcrR family transcriptional regulator n=1 Tax=Paenibacillus sp. PCH8 TaxID=2066524 RepID=UPI000CF8D54E|nr:TetR/AcrR family transcriptional regulator [Paenibacillus sp. PCH8]PQP82352.1 TetR/AcrR family transcriptional regulator [Paenibacillus sp. PCH8]
MVKDTAASVNRRNDIISAAIEIFAETGYYRATTAQVAERAQISQPYIFRFFKTKEDLLLTALEVSWARVIDTFRTVVETATPEKLESDLIEAYEQILESHKSEILLQTQAQTIREEVIRQAMQQGIGGIRTMVLKAFIDAGIPQAEEKTKIFLAVGLLCNMSVALNMPELMRN